MTKRSSRWQRMFRSFNNSMSPERVNKVLTLLQEKTGATHPDELFGREAKFTAVQVVAASSWLRSLLYLREPDSSSPGVYDWEELMYFSSEPEEEDEEDETAVEDSAVPEDVVHTRPAPDASPPAPFPERYFIGDPALNHTLGRIASYKELEPYCFGDWDDALDLEPLETYLFSVAGVNEDVEPDNILLLFLASRSLVTLQVKTKDGYTEFSREAGSDPNTLYVEHITELLNSFDLDHFDPEVAGIVRQRIAEIEADDKEQRDRPYIEWEA
jgi:hypothetical protein